MSTLLSNRIGLGRLTERVPRIEPFRLVGEVVDIVGLVVKSRGPDVAVGDFCEILTRKGRRIRSQVVGFRDGLVTSIPLEEPDGLTPGDEIVGRSSAARIGVGDALLGRVIDGFGKPLDSGPPIRTAESRDLFAIPPGPLEREHIDEQLITGIRAIDGFLPCGQGQRVGIFGGSGVGKSTLLGCLARRSSADVNVIALVGERNREVRGFVENDLGPEGIQRSVTVVATSDRPAPLRVRACFVATAIAEYFREQGKNVLLVVDSVTRLAMAQREIGLAGGEPPSQKGYTPSVFALLPKVFERAGRFRRGSITGFYTVLVEGDDFNEPIADAVRSILDGHTVLSRDLASSGHYPAIDVEQSISRLSSALATKPQLVQAAKLRECLSSYRQARDLIQLGAYRKGADPKLDAAVAVQEQLSAFLRQLPETYSSAEETLEIMATIASQLPR